MHIAVDPRGTRHPATPTTRVAMTPVTRGPAEPTFRAPLRGDGETRGEAWTARSDDGAWHYLRLDDDTSPWQVTYVPSGQVVEDLFCTLARARAATVEPATLLALRQAAFRAALGAAPTVEGARWLAAHLRVAGADQPDARCTCGGMLAEVTSDGRLAHLDACERCATVGEAGIGKCEQAREHRFCATPRRA